MISVKNLFFSLCKLYSINQEKLEKFVDGSGIEKIFHPNISEKKPDPSIGEQELAMVPVKSFFCSHFPTIF